MESERRQPAWLLLVAAIAVAAMLSFAIPAIFVLAPTEQSMGDAQRIVYLHVSVAWFGVVSFLATAVAGLAYLVRRDLGWDQWSQAAGEVAWLCSTLTLLTGSMWAHAAWNTWWTWDPRLTSAFVLWAILSGYHIVRASVEDPRTRARLAAILAILGMLDLPLLVMATSWFRSIHPRGPQMEPSMRAVLLMNIASFSALFALLLVRRRAQLRLQEMLASFERAAGRKTEVETPPAR
jgi:heme exporter protein C